MSDQTIVLKLSGEALGASRPLDGHAFENVAEQIAELTRIGFRVGVVIGGGNILRGNQEWGRRGLPSVAKDELGMLATSMNAFALKHQLELMDGVKAKVISNDTAPCALLCDLWDARAFDSDEGVVIVAGGTGRPGVSTDVAAPQLARDMRAERIIMSKHGVDGLYPEDPNRPNRIGSRPLRITSTTMSRVLRDKLMVMDRDAMVLCRKFHLTVQIVAANSPSSILQAARGESTGSIIHPV